MIPYFAMSQGQEVKSIVLKTGDSYKGENHLVVV